MTSYIDGYNPPTSSYQLPPDGTVDSYMILGNRMPMHNGGEYVCVCVCVSLYMHVNVLKTTNNSNRMHTFIILLVQPQPVQPQPVQPQPRMQHKPLNKKLDVLGRQQIKGMLCLSNYHMYTRCCRNIYSRTSELT